MSKFEIARSRMLNDLDSFTPLIKRDRSFGHVGKESTKSSERDIFRYSYNLGKQRTKKLQRAASLAADIGGGVIQKNQEDGDFTNDFMRRRAFPRSMSMESEPALNYTDKMRLDSMCEDVPRGTALDTRVAQMDVSRESEQITALDVKPDTIENNKPVEKQAGNHFALDIGQSETHKKPSDNARPKSGSLSGSVPDLRIIANVEKSKSNCEDFPSFLSPDSTEKAQSRPICKLRRAARRLGVSLSSEELYHKQRRNGVCTEIDDAADNRKLLRVLNKRF